MPIPILMADFAPRNLVNNASIQTNVPPAGAALTTEAPSMPIEEAVMHQDVTTVNNLSGKSLYNQ